MEQAVSNAVSLCISEGLQRIILSNANKASECSKCRVTPVLIKGVRVFQIEKQINAQVFHENCTEDEILNKVLALLDEMKFRQAELISVFFVRTVLIGKRGTATVKTKKISGNEIIPKNLTHNREKQYLLPDGVKVPFLADLSVMTEDGKVVKAHFDKFRQINRFLEFIEDILPELPKDKELKILDFGCGKSYLTFALYYFLHEKRGYDVSITGLDLKEDVILHCNQLAQKYGYTKLNFLCGDIAGYDEDAAADLVVTLHACDTATDYALAKAVKWGTRVILSVPCCQHEWNRQMECKELSAYTKFGIIRERMSALMTDAFRGNVLTACGYKTQLLEFIDMEHTPKNILIRAVKKKELTEEERLLQLQKEPKEMMTYAGTEPMLYRLLLQKD